MWRIPPVVGGHHVRLHHDDLHQQWSVPALLLAKEVNSVSFFALFNQKSWLLGMNGQPFQWVEHLFK
jgi:hypothetical protein